jgi:endo-1,4-beta-xylanase
MISSLKLSLLPLLLACAFGCSSSSTPPAAPGDGDGDQAGDGDAPGSGGTVGGNTGGTTGDGDAQTLKTVYADYFPIGVAIGPSHLTTVKDIVTREFNHLTCENDMKVQSIQPTEGNFNFVNADAIADLARTEGMKMTGHTFVWHRQAPAWLFAGLTAGDAASIATLTSRLQSHIETLVGRYADVVDNWDVVNEAISDDGTKDFRDAADGSEWFRIFGSEEYVYTAFKLAHEALEANEAGSSKGKLYYNDYNVTLKVDRIIKMLDAIKARGVPVDGVGMQGHVRMDWPSVADYRAAIGKLVAAGYKVKISELDMTMYNDYPTGVLMAAPEVPFTPELEAQQAAAYGSLFALFREHKANITSVTLWGVSDDQTWLDNEPVPGRDNFPLLFDDAHEPKEAYFAVRDF